MKNLMILIMASIIVGFCFVKKEEADGRVERLNKEKEHLKSLYANDSTAFERYMQDSF